MVGVVGPKQSQPFQDRNRHEHVGDQHTRGDAMHGSKPAENTAQKQRGRPFEPEKSGNPKGRPKGSRNQATLLAEALLDGKAETLTRKRIEKGSDGDTNAPRLVPARRERRVTFDLPSKIETAADAAKASSAVLTECAAGNLSPNEAATIMALISSHAPLGAIGNRQLGRPHTRGNCTPRTRRSERENDQCSAQLSA